MTTRERKLERIRRATEAHRPTLAVTLVGSLGTVRIALPLRRAA